MRDGLMPTTRLTSVARDLPARMPEREGDFAGPGVGTRAQS